MSPKLPRITAQELLRALRRDGWVELRQSGSHIQLRHPSKPGRVTIAYHAGRILKPATLDSILEDAGLLADQLSGASVKTRPP
jgi:predicted RNA binding protein YcfA (HicA-like mRNA interferase family)